MSGETKSHYRVFLTDEASRRAVEIGVVTLSDEHKIRLVSAVPDRREFLEKLMARTNNADIIHVRAVPPPEAEEGAIYAGPVERSDEGLREAMTDRLKKRYGIEH